MTRPEFYYEEFEDYLFNAIQLSRNLTADDCVYSGDVLRQLSLATYTVENFLNSARQYSTKELEPKGNLVAPGSHEGIDKKG